MAAKALIFDLDGTIWDSAPWFAAGLTTDPEIEAKLALSLRQDGNIVHAIKLAGITRARLLRDAQRRSGPPQLFDGIANAIKNAAERGVTLAVATSLPGTLALPMLEMVGLKHAFACIIHAGVCRTPKPSPASINMAMRALAIGEPKSAVYVGDRLVDAQAASRAGMMMAWISHGYETPVSGEHIVVIGAEDIARL